MVDRTVKRFADKITLKQIKGKMLQREQTRETLPKYGPGLHTQSHVQHLVRFGEL